MREFPLKPAESETALTGGGEENSSLACTGEREHSPLHLAACV